MGSATRAGVGVEADKTVEEAVLLLEVEADEDEEASEGNAEGNAEVTHDN